MTNAKVSVIMPIYNVEKYLEESIDSVLSQTLKDIEIICVDDGSTDKSSEIIDIYALKDSRIKAIHKNNTGYGNSMNVGIDNASGKYIAILEPDDFITSDMLADLYEIAETNNIDIVKSDFAYLEGERDSYIIRPTKIYADDSLYNKILSLEEKNILFKGYIAHWTCLYNRSFLKSNNIYFNETPGASYQDTGFWFQTIMYAKRMYLSDKYYYHYRQDNPNASMLSKAKVDCISKEYDYVFDILKSSGNLFNEYLPVYISCRFASHLDTINRIADEYKLSFINNMAEYFSDLKDRALFDTDFMNKQEIDIISDIITDPKGYYKKIMEKSIIIHEEIENYMEVFIYGAGYVGQKIYKSMLDTDKSKMKGFLVTQNKDNIKSLLGKTIYELSQVADLGNYGVIIGVSERYQEEIINNLRTKCVKNIILLPEII